MEKQMKMDTTESSDNDSDNEENDEIEKRAEELEREIVDNKYLYDCHVELVGLYKQLADLTSMRLAYERFHETYPLTSALWMAWLKDEMQLASTETEKKNVLKLFDIATQDYLSISLWLEYAQFALGCCELDEPRAILEKALREGGLHTVQGSLLWDTLRELEIAHLSLNEPNTDAFNSQLLKVVDVFKRQLSVPLINMENTYAEFCELLKQYPSIDAKPIEWGYKNALKSLQIQKPFEDRLLVTTNENDILVIYKDYIKSVKDTSMIICLYERAIEKLCLNPEIWLDYCYFMYKLGGDAALNISKRAIRNVTWNEDLWIIRLGILEKTETVEADVMNCFENGIAGLIQANCNGLELWLAFVGYIKRNNPSRLMKLFEQAEQQQVQDPTYKLTRLHARICFKEGDYKTGCALYNNVMKDHNIKTYAHYWLEYINLERQYGNIQQLRVLFSRALTCCRDWPQSIAEEWLMLERQEGSLDDLMKANEKIKKTIADKPQQQQAPLEVKSNKRKAIEKEAPVKKIKVEPVIRKNQGPPKDLDQSKAVFLSNLSPTNTETQIKQLFPNSLAVTLATNNKGESRCFGYIQFATSEEAQDALKRDRELLNKRPMFLSKCKGDTSEKEFRFATTVENNKLFVRGLPIKHKKEHVEAIFKKFNCTDVRLVLHKSGQSKGLAYVDFANDDDAEKALKATNQMKIGMFTITVAVSAPPSKHKNEQPVRHSKSRLEIPTKLDVPSKMDVDSKCTITDEPVTDKSKPKSNSDFRDMFFK